MERAAMNIRKFAFDLVIIFAVVFVVSTVIGYLYSLMAHGDGAVDWAGSVRLGLTFGIVLSWLHQRERK
jgi:hypothetical protein